MECFSLMLAMCLLAGLSQCQAEENQTQVTELTHEDLTDSWVQKDVIQDANQGLEEPAILRANSTGTRPSCEPPIFTVLKELGALQEKLTATVRALEETDKKLEASEKKLSELNSKVDERCSEDRGRPQVAFSAALPIDGTIGPLNVLHPLVYRHVESNIGGHYSPVTGFFTAPVKGVYSFTFTSFCWAASSGNCGVSLYKNGGRIVSWYAYSKNHPSSGSNSAVLQLHVGDKVSVYLWDNHRISDNGNKYASFSGFLLFPL